MLKRITLATVAAAIALPVAVLSTGPANADTGNNGCTKAEFNSIRKGMTIAQVTRICGNGRRTFYYDGTYIPDEQDREYQPRSSWSLEEVDYYRIGGVWKVHSKSGYWI